MAKKRTWLYAFLGAAFVIAVGFLDELICRGWLPAAQYRWARPTYLCAFIILSILFEALAILAERPRRPATESLLWTFWDQQLSRREGVRVTIFVIRRKPFFYRWSTALGRIRQGGKVDFEYAAIAMRQPDREFSGIRFIRGEGAVGIAWTASKTYEAQNLPRFDDDMEAFLTEQESLGIRREKAEKLSRKCESYVCSPIYCRGDESTVRGILSVDAMKGTFSPQDVKSIERFAHYLAYLQI